MALTTKQKEFIELIGKAATADMKKTKILACITVAQAILESGWGTSELALKAFNLFGIKDNNAWTGATYTVVSKEEINGELVDKKSKFRKYNSWAESIADHSNYLCTRSFDGGKTLLYKSVIGETDYKKAANALLTAGYCTHSDYAEKLIKLIEQYDLTKYNYVEKKEEKKVSENKDLIRIFLDAGHGMNGKSGGDPGACYGTRKESKDVLKLVLAIGKKLENDYTNAVIGYARKTEIYESVTKKRKDANAFKSDYVFSFHRNSYNKKAKGYETLYYSHSEVKDAIMEDIADEMVELGFVHRGDKKRTDLGILKADAPALLFEIGFIDNKADNKIFDKKFDAIVEAFVKVIAKNCGLKKKTSGKKFAVGNYNATVKITKECAVRTGRGKTYKKLGTLAVGKKVKVLYIAKSATGNLWGSIEWDGGKNGVAYIYLGNCKPV